MVRQYATKLQADSIPACCGLKGISAEIAGTGFSLIAVTYGMARFSWGLMLPAISAEIPFNPQQAGMLSACSFVAYCREQHPRLLRVEGDLR